MRRAACPVACRPLPRDALTLSARLQSSLYYRDQTYIGKKTPHGEKVFWGAYYRLEMEIGREAKRGAGLELCH